MIWTGGLDIVLHIILAQLRRIRPKSGDISVASMEQRESLRSRAKLASRENPNRSSQLPSTLGSIERGLEFMKDQTVSVFFVSGKESEEALDFPPYAYTN